MERRGKKFQFITGFVILQNGGGLAVGKFTGFRDDGLRMGPIECRAEVARDFKELFNTNRSLVIHRQ